MRSLVIISVISAADDKTMLEMGSMLFDCRVTYFEYCSVTLQLL